MTFTPLEDFFHHLDRSQFMTGYTSMAHLDEALPIGYGQTISQPSLVLAMTKTLNLTSDSRVLEIGTGSGYQTCLLAEFSKVLYTIERIPQLRLTAEERLTTMGYTNIHFIDGDGSIGWAEAAPYDRIIVTAAAAQVPEELTNQLAPEGIMVIPVGTAAYQNICLVCKDIDENVYNKMLEAVRFVPLVGKYSI